MRYAALVGGSLAMLAVLVAFVAVVEIGRGMDVGAAPGGELGAYPADAEASFLGQYDNMAPAVGRCALAETERRYTYAEFQAMARRYGGTGTTPPEVRAFVTDCALRYG